MMELPWHLIKKSIPKWNSKRYRQLQKWCAQNEVPVVFGKCERCNKTLLNPQSILLHMGGFCKHEFEKNTGMTKETFEKAENIKAIIEKLNTIIWKINKLKEREADEDFNFLLKECYDLANAHLLNQQMKFDAL